MTAWRWAPLFTLMAGVVVGAPLTGPGEGRVLLSRRAAQSVDLGEADLSNGMSRTFEVKVENDTSSSVRIESLHPECGYTAVRMSHHEILPGCTAIMEGEIHFRDEGAFTGSIEVAFDGEGHGPGRLLVVLAVRGIWKGVSVRPQSVGLSRVGAQKRIGVHVTHPPMSEVRVEVERELKASGALEVTWSRVTAVRSVVQLAAAAESEYTGRGSIDVIVTPRGSSSGIGRSVHVSIGE